MDFSKNYYKVLDIQHTATGEEIKKAYRQMAHQYHPDKNIKSRFAEEQFRAIKEAYEILSDPLKRRQYDSVRRSLSISPYAFSREFGKTFLRDEATVRPADMQARPDQSKYLWLKPLIFILIALLTVALIMRMH